MMLLVQPTKVTQPEKTYVSETIYKTTNSVAIEKLLGKKTDTGVSFFLDI